MVQQLEATLKMLQQQQKPQQQAEKPFDDPTCSPAEGQLHSRVVGITTAELLSTAQQRAAATAAAAIQDVLMVDRCAAAGLWHLP